MTTPPNNNQGHQLAEMTLPDLPTDNLDLYVHLSRRMEDFKALLVHIVTFRRKVLSQEKNNERYGPPVRYDDGRTELEFHLSEDDPVILEGVSASDYPPCDWPKKLDLL